MKRLSGIAILCAVIVAGYLLVNGPQWAMKTISAPEDGSKRKPTMKEIERHRESAQRRKLDQ